MAEAWAINAGLLLRRAAERLPGKTAIIWEGGSRTYGELLRRVNRLAEGLIEQGICPGDRVALLFHNGPQFVESWWAVVQAGGVAVPLSTRALPGELRATISDAEAAAIFVGADLWPPLADVQADLPSLRSIVVSGEGWAASRPRSSGGARFFDYENLAAGPEVQATDLWPALSDPCAIYYTAGTTGASKGAVRTHLSVTWGLGVLAARIRADEVYLARAPMYHTGGSLTGPFAALVAGATLVSMRAFDARALLDNVERHGVTRLYLHPALVANALLEELERRARRLDSIRYLQWTAGPLPEAIRARILERFPGLPFETTYGMTEVSNIASYEYLGGPIKPANCVGLGPPGSRIAIVDEVGKPVGAGQPGEIVVRSPTAMAGYWRDTVATAQVLVDGWLHTGDLGHLDADGLLHLAGRQKDAIITGGETVHASEVESVLAGIAGLAEAAVIGLPDATWGEAVSAVVVRAPGASVDATDIVTACRRELPGYKCPKRVIFADAIPRNAIGKVVKRQLMERYGDLESG